VRVAKDFGITVKVVAKGMDYLKLVERPRHGYGRALNPCIDCRIFMHIAAREMMVEEGASFLVTGEVLGQRPMSQRRAAMEIIERESGTADLILRPLSAQHFAPIRAEREGLVDRDRLLAIEGRSRKEQIRLAEELGVSDYPCPAGGCLLTDPEFAGRLADLFEHKPDYELADVRLLRSARHFRLRPGLKILVGRKQQENETLQSAADGKATLFQGLDFSGPTALIREQPTPADEIHIGRLLLRYAKVASGRIAISGPGGSRELTVTEPLNDAELERLRIGSFDRQRQQAFIARQSKTPS
jgi:tRNA U34 2-thiouridine synthase MnmA/TrmU